MELPIKEWIFLEKSGKKSWISNAFPICGHHNSGIPNKRVGFWEKSGKRVGKRVGKEWGKSGIPLKKSGINQWNGVARKRVENSIVWLSLVKAA